MTTQVSALKRGGVRPGFRWRMFGSAAPMFPGFEVEITDRVGDHDKPDAVWHRERGRQILQAHPEVRDLIGHEPFTAVWCLTVAGAQVALAALMAGQPWWMLLLVAWTAGAWLNVCLFELAHQCNHGLVFQKTSWNRWLFTATTLPMFLSGHHTWWIEHLVHHNDFGAKKDFITRRRSFFLMTRRVSPLFLPYSLIMLVTQMVRSLAGLVLYVFGSLLRGRLDPGPRALAVLTDVHLVSGYRRNQFLRWAVVYPLLSLGLAAGLFLYGGWRPVLYLLLSQAFMTGFLHPLMFGIVLSISHFHGHRRYQPTSSYYGWLNRIGFNLGMHTEHHDLAGIPSNRIPQVRRLAPEFYDDLLTIRSYTGLTWKFLSAGAEDYAGDWANEEQRNQTRFATDR